jgi:hypothetical protein
MVQADREESGRQFSLLVRAMEPDVVIDLICFKLDSARELVEALHDQINHFLHCGTIWKHGPATEVPLLEEADTEPFGEYGIRKAAIERYLLKHCPQHRFSCHHLASRSYQRPQAGIRSTRRESESGGV